MAISEEEKRRIKREKRREKQKRKNDRKVFGDDYNKGYIVLYVVLFFAALLILALISMGISAIFWGKDNNYLMWMDNALDVIYKAWVLICLGGYFLWCLIKVFID